jgi:hypothetical protein
MRQRIFNIAILCNFLFLFVSFSRSGYALDQCVSIPGNLERLSDELNKKSQLSISCAESNPDVISVRCAATQSGYDCKRSVEKLFPGWMSPACASERPWVKLNPRKGTSKGNFSLRPAYRVSYRGETEYVPNAKTIPLGAAESESETGSDWCKRTVYRAFEVNQSPLYSTLGRVPEGCSASPRLAWQEKSEWKFIELSKFENWNISAMWCAGGKLVFGLDASFELGPSIKGVGIWNLKENNITLFAEELPGQTTANQIEPLNFESLLGPWEKVQVTAFNGDLLLQGDRKQTVWVSAENRSWSSFNRETESSPLVKKLDEKPKPNASMQLDSLHGLKLTVSSMKRDIAPGETIVFQGEVRNFTGKEVFTIFQPIPFAPVPPGCSLKLEKEFYAFLTQEYEGSLKMPLGDYAGPIASITCGDKTPRGAKYKNDLIVAFPNNLDEKGQEQRYDLFFEVTVK